MVKKNVAAACTIASVPPEDTLGVPRPRYCSVPCPLGKPTPRDVRNKSSDRQLTLTKQAKCGRAYTSELSRNGMRHCSYYSIPGIQLFCPVSVPALIFFRSRFFFFSIPHRRTSCYSSPTFPHIWQVTTCCMRSSRSPIDPPTLALFLYFAGTVPYRSHLPRRRSSTATDRAEIIF